MPKINSMQGIDFKPVLNKPQRSKDQPSPGRLTDFSRSSAVKEESARSPVSIYISIAIIFFTIGLVSGVKWYSVKMTKQIEETALSAQKSVTANNLPETPVMKESVAKPANQAEESEKATEIQKAPADKSQYIILARMYRDHAKAEKFGYLLKQAGLPVFLAENGKKMKIYVGPITGRQDAYKMLARVKKVREFKGAILYKR